MKKFLQVGSVAVIALMSGNVWAASDSDDVDYLFRLGMLQGHLIVGHDLLHAGKVKLAVPHFGHPVRELYDDIKGYLHDHKVADFDDALIDLEVEVIKSPNGAQAEAKYQEVIARIERARNEAPAAVRDSVPAMIEICSDTIDAAAGEYGEALAKGRIDDIVEYHDSRGFVSYVAEAIAKLAASHTRSADTSLIDKFKAVLAKAQEIVAPLIPPETPAKSVADYRAVAAEARKLVKPSL